MALQHTADNTFIWLTLPDGTETCFSFGEYLVWAAYEGPTVTEDDWEDEVTWLEAPNNVWGRGNAWSNVVRTRMKYPDDPAIKAFRKYAVENNIPI